MTLAVQLWLLGVGALVGGGLALFEPHFGVALAASASFVAGIVVVLRNVLALRLGYYVSLVGLALALYSASRSVPLGLAPLAFGLPVHAVEWVMRRWRGLHGVQSLIGLLVGGALLWIARDSAGWLLGAAPIAALALLAATTIVGVDLAGRSARRRCVLQLGRPMPDFELPYRSAEGTFRLAQQRGRYVLLCFVRGDWCPVCHVLMRVIVREAPLLERHGVQVVLITPSTGEMDEGLRASLGIQSPMVLDQGARLAGALGLIEGRHRGEDVPLPVALLVGPDGTLLDISRPDDVTAFTSESRIAKVLRQRGEAAQAEQAGES